MLKYGVWLLGSMLLALFVKIKIVFLQLMATLSTKKHFRGTKRNLFVNYSETRDTYQWD